MGLRRRVRGIEERLAAETVGKPSEAFVRLRAVLDELAALKSSCAPRMRGGIPVEPEHIPRKILGPGYTHNDLLALAAERAAEGGAFPVEEAPRYTAAFKESYGRRKDHGVGVEWERRGA